MRFRRNELNIIEDYSSSMWDEYKNNMGALNKRFYTSYIYVLNLICMRNRVLSSRDFVTGNCNFRAQSSGSRWTPSFGSKIAYRGSDFRFLIKTLPRVNSFIVSRTKGKKNLSTISWRVWKSSEKLCAQMLAASYYI